MLVPGNWESGYSRWAHRAGAVNMGSRNRRSRSADVEVVDWVATNSNLGIAAVDEGLTGTCQDINHVDNWSFINSCRGSGRWQQGSADIASHQGRPLGLRRLSSTVARAHT